MKDHRALLVKHRKSYYVWTLFDACLERREREGFLTKKNKKEPHKPMRSIGVSFAPNAISSIIYSDNRRGSPALLLAGGTLDDSIHHQPAQPSHFT